MNSVSCITADMGGNDELPPLKFAFNMPMKEGYEKKIFFLTDGGVGNHGAVVKLVADNSKAAKVFTFGIECSGSDEKLVIDTARVGGGTCSIIRNNSDLKSKVIAALCEASELSLKDCKF